MKNVKVGILGVGAIGTSVAAELVENEQLQLLGYNRSIRSGIHVLRDNVIQSLPMTVYTAANDAKLDWLIICLKAHQYEGARHWYHALISPKTNIVVVRNGIHLKESMRVYTSNNNILACIIDCPTQMESLGMYRQFNRPIFTLERSILAEAFTQLFNGSKAIVNLVEDFHTAAWCKLCESAALGSILCLAGETTWIFNNNPKLQLLHRQLLQECIAVARADDAKISPNFINEVCRELLLYPDNKGSSMLSDRIEGRPIELMAKNGIVSELSEQYEINTPINDMICTLLERTNCHDL